MKAGFLKIPAPVWLVMSYALLGGLVYWSGNQEPGQLSASVFFVCLLGSWIPAYVYVNRRDMVQNKVFWISQGAALAVAVVVLCLLSPWGGVAGGVIAYVAAHSFFTSLIRSSFNFTESRVEKLLNKKPGDTQR